MASSTTWNRYEAPSNGRTVPCESGNTVKLDDKNNSIFANWFLRLSTYTRQVKYLFSTRFTPEIEVQKELKRVGKWEKTETGVRVVVDETVVAKELKPEMVQTLEHRRGGERNVFPVKSNELYGKKFVASSQVNANCVFPTNNGLLAAVMLAYNNHIPLKLRPDDLWIAIILSFGQYVQKNAGKVRKDFVVHEGKRMLVVPVPLSWEMSDRFIAWPTVIEKIADLIQDNTVNQVRQAIEADFSTSDSVSITASRLVLMSSLKSFFEYGTCTTCGIREVYLEGTLEDWIKLRSSVANLGSLSATASHELSDWLSNLDTTLLKLVETYEGNPDSGFWSHIYSRFCTFGSGGETYVTGWILSFFLYDSSGDMINSSQVPTTTLSMLPVMYSTVPFFFQTSFGRRNFTMLSGSWGVEVSKGIVSPIIQWMVTEDKYSFFDWFKVGLAGAVCSGLWYYFF